ncbi:MAG: site-2 protease family protein [Planctomycetaceae bacterium]|nr:site-2 protease family protein [Planctomycetaceae bacterium]
MFGQVQPTPWDIDFSLLGIPVKVSPFFWLIAIIFGWGLGDPSLVVLWVIAMFFSILVHEMGHALMARAFGYDPHIVLHHMGGYASYVPGYHHSLWKSIAISLAGPFAGFGLLGIVFGTELLLVANNIDTSYGLNNFFWFLTTINLYWGIINLLPVLPLDGGQVCRDVLLLFRRDGEVWAMRISIAVGIGMAVLFLQFGMRYPAILFGLLAFNNLQALNHRRDNW